MIVVSAGWAKTCATYKKLAKDAKYSYLASDFHCKGYQYINSPPNGAEFIAAGVS